MRYNHLKNEKSPYLIQHSQNPVEWYPWGEEAFKRAKAEGRPVFLSIGYSACHWCHVMAHESFEDEEVAAMLNDAFVSIKVDREERPDIDNFYMAVCQAMTQSGGWPLTIVMTPEKKPFFAATYIPKETRYGRTGLVELIPEIHSIWVNKRNEIENAAEEIIDNLKNIRQETGENAPDEGILRTAYEAFEKIYDRQYGGFGPAPKFPTPHNFFFLLRYWNRAKENRALQMVEETLQHMRRGGIYDHVGYGFHRYSTDDEWHVPHFEKMLYDQALMAMAYAEAFQATGKPIYEKTVREIFAYVLQDMTDDKGGFYSAEDADSEGMEGAYYLWTPEEIRAALTKDEADLFLSMYYYGDNNKMNGLRDAPGGGFIPRLKKNFRSRADDKGNQMPENIREKLFAFRSKRIHPHKDDKILADWNGLMIAALAKGAQALNEPGYAAAARRAVDFIMTGMRDEDGGLLHSYRDGLASIPGMIDDYSFMIWGLLELFEAGFDAKHLHAALELNDYLAGNFWDDRDGGFFFTHDEAEKLPVRRKEIHDGAVPSGNSVSLLNFVRLGGITGDRSFEKKAAKIAGLFAGRVVRSPSAFTQFLAGFDFMLGPASEVVIAGDPEHADTREMLKTLRTNFLPRKVVLLNRGGEQPGDMSKIAPFAGQYGSLNGRATAYVCSDYSCQAPTNDPVRMLAYLNTINVR